MVKNIAFGINTYIIFRANCQTILVIYFSQYCMYTYLGKFTGTDKTIYLTPCGTDLISRLWCWASYETILHLGHTGLNIWMRFTLRLNTQARKTRYTRYFAQHTSDHPLAVWHVGSYTYYRSLIYRPPIMIRCVALS